MKKRRIIKAAALAAGIALSLSLVAACGGGEQTRLNYDGSVAKAFRAVAPAQDLVSQTAVADGSEYLVTVITSSSVSEYRVDSAFRVESSNAIIGETPSPARLASLSQEEGEQSDLERAFSEALTLSGIPMSEITGFDFDQETYMGRAVFKVEIEDRTAEYTYLFDAADFSLISSKTELKGGAPASGSSYITEEQAKAIALDAAGVPAGAEVALKTVSEGGRKMYEAGFDFEGFRYTLLIDALSGDIVKLSKTVLDGAVSAPEIPSIITEEEAKEIALAFAFPEGAQGHEVRFDKVQLDYEKGGFVYELEFVADGTEYELDISAADGTILDAEMGAEEKVLPPTAFLTREEAVAKVREQAGQDAFLLEADIEKEFVNGEIRYFYEIEMKVGGREYEYFVDAVTGEVTLNDGYAGNPVDPNPGTSLTEERALAIALESFSLTEEQITSQRIKLEREDGRLCYEIKLYVGPSEYKMEIDAVSGKILEREIDIEHEQELPAPSTGTVISRDKALEALKQYFAAQNVTARIDELELEDEGTGANKRFYYEAEVVIGGREYEYVVDAVTGEVSKKGEVLGAGKELIGEEKALSIALGYFSLSESEVRIGKVKLEEDDGMLIYEVELKVRSIEYTVEIDAQTGRVIESDIDYD